MKKENTIYLIAGIIFGFVIGLLASYMMFSQKDVEAQATPEMPKSAMPGMQQPPEHMDIMQEIEALKTMLQKDPSNYQALVRLGNLYFDASKFQQAQEYYSKAIEQEDSDPNVLTDLAICYRNTGDPNKAIEFFEQANRKDPAHWQSIYNVFIVALNDLKDIPAAEEAIRRLEKIKPDFEGLEKMKAQIKTAKEQKGT